MQEDDVRMMLKKHVTALGTQQALAHKIDISEQYLSEIIRGRKSPPKIVLDWLGVESRTEYFRVKPTATSEVS